MSRRADQMRPVTIERNYPTAAAGSVLISCGQTRVICTASVSDDLPPWLAKAEPPRGWVTAEYSMLPGSTPDRQRRKPSSRGTEIQRLIGRSLRAAVDLGKMPGVQITCDCDVIYADGGTRTASITGAVVALADAVRWAREKGMIQGNPIVGPVAAISTGIIDGKAHLDLDYPLDSRAEVDLNVVMNHRGRFVEIQGTGEQGTFTGEELETMLKLARKGIKRLITMQRKALKGD